MSGGVIFHGRARFEALTARELAARGLSAPLFVVLADYRITVEDLGEIVVPAGFETDWASIPGFARPWLNPDDPTILLPSLPHDLLYSLRGQWSPNEAPLTRERVDDLLRRGMVACGASAFRAWTVYRAVRIGGGAHWGSQT